MIKSQITRWQHFAIFFYAFIALLLVFIPFFSYRSLSTLIEKEHWVKHTNQVILTSQEILITINEAESSQRGYIITSDSLYLKNYRENIQAVQSNLKSLTFLTKDTPRQLEQVEILKDRLNNKIKLMNQSISWRNKNNISLLHVHFSQGTGRQSMDAVKESLNKIVEGEEKLLTARSGELDATRRLTLRAIYIFTGIALLVIILLHFLYRQHVRVKNTFELSIHKANLELASANEELQASMEEISAGNEQLTELNEKLQQSQDSLQQLNGQLEKKVEVRTAELTAINRRLRIEVAERRLAEDALQKARDLYKDLYDNAPEMYLSVNLKTGTIINCNKRFLQKLGYSKDEVIDQPVLNFHYSKTLEEGKAAIEELKEKGSIENVPLKIVTKKGKALDMLLSSTVIQNESGEMIATRGCWQDITELKKIQDELREREEHFRLLTENASDLISKHRLDGTYTYASPASLPLLGYNPEELVGKSAFQFFHPDDIEPVTELHSPENDLPDQIQFSYRKRNKAGEYIWYETTGKALRDETGKVTELLCVSRDISERKKAEEILKKNSLKLETANKELESFSYSVSHDLRAPLRAIIGYSKILLNDFEGKLGGEGKEIAGYIIKNTSKMGMLIDDLLAFSRLGRQEKKDSEFDMNLMVEDVVKELKFINRDRKINFNTEPLPHSKGDPALIRHVVSNLLSNAVKFTAHREEAEITISSFIQEGEVVYAFRDNGVGFNMKYVGKIFDVFQRLHSEAEFPGTGIGLALAQKIIHRHGGSIWAEGEINNGASFYFTLPKTT